MAKLFDMLRAVRPIIVVLFALSAIGMADELPSQMTKLMVKVESPEIPKDSFAAQAKRMYRAGSRFCRIEETPDLANHIHGLLIINEPDSWLINRLDNNAKHMIDPGPTYNCRMPIFVDSDEIRTSQDIKSTLMQLEFGREFEFFKPRSDPPKVGPILRGKETKVYSTEVGSEQLFLFTSGNPEAPVAVIRKNDKTRQIVWYGEYEQVPFDAELFSAPNGLQIDELK